MTEAEWLSCNDPQEMHTSVPTALEQARHGDKRIRRKRELFGAACCRLIWPLITDERSRRCVEYMEQQFDEDQSLPLEEGNAIHRAAGQVIDDTPGGDLHEAAFAVHLAQEPAYFIDILMNHLNTWSNPQLRARVVANLMRDVVGNPFRPVTFDPAWLTSDVIALARQMYKSRDFGAMPVLADALQDAGCDNPDMLAHCRSGGPHVRGCWVVDLVLGKE